MSSPSQSTVKEHVHNHWAFAWVPLFGAFIWFGMLLAMFAAWGGLGDPRYEEQVSAIPYISDIGASFLQPLFITGGCITAVCFFLSVCIEKYLRNTGRRESVFAYLAILGGAIGGAGLILLTIFDTLRHTNLHRIFLLVFIVGVALSAILSILEYRWLSKDFAELRRVKLAYVAKGVIATSLILCAIVFGACLYEGSKRMNQTASFVGGVFEWLISFGFTLYILTFWYDVHLSKGISKGTLTKADIEANGLPHIGEGAATEGQSDARTKGHTDTHEMRQL